MIVIIGNDYALAVLYKKREYGKDIVGTGCDKPEYEHHRFRLLYRQAYPFPVDGHLSRRTQGRPAGARSRRGWHCYDRNQYPPVPGGLCLPRDALADPPGPGRAVKGGYRRE